MYAYAAVAVLAGCGAADDAPLARPTPPTAPMAEAPAERPVEISQPAIIPERSATHTSTTTIDETVGGLRVKGRQSQTVGPGLIEQEQTLDVTPK